MSMHLISSEKIERKIFLIRGKKVMLSPDLAKLYGVEARALVQAVKRNVERFPMDFMFQLTNVEFKSLKSQFVISSWGGLRRANPYAFTDYGILMLSSALKSSRAVQINIQIMRTFTKLREMVLAHKDLATKIEEMEKKYDHQFLIVFDAIKKLLKIPRKQTAFVKGFAKNRISP